MSNQSLTAPTTTCCSTRTSRYIIFLGLAFSGCITDLVTKSAIFAWRGEPEPGSPNIYWLVKGYVGIETALNEGALFGLGQKMVWLFALMSCLALLGIGYWMVRRQGSDDLVLTVTLGIITGGILGNLYDRLGFWSNFQTYAVRDWIRLSYDYHRFVWPNFNVADSLLVCGAALLVWHSMCIPPQDPGRQKP